MERWCPTQQMLGVFLRRLLVKKLLTACSVDAHALEDALRDEARERAEARALWKKAKHYGAE
jgi:hypothetical protein